MNFIFQEFSKWFMNEFKAINFPSTGSVFDFYVDNHQQDFAPWVQRVPKFELDPDIPLQAVLVHTAGSHFKESNQSQSLIYYQFFRKYVKIYLEFT